MDCDTEALLGPDDEAILIRLTEPELAMLEAEAKTLGLSVEALARRRIEEAHRRLAEGALALPGHPAGH